MVVGSAGEAAVAVAVAAAVVVVAVAESVADAWAHEQLVESSPAYLNSQSWTWLVEQEEVERLGLNHSVLLLVGMQSCIVFLVDTKGSGSFRYCYC